MERTKLLTIAVIGLLFINAATLGFLLLKKPPHPEGRRDEPFKIIIDKLHFDEAQQQKYMEMVKIHREAFEKLNETSRHLHHQYYDLLQSNSINTTAADSLNEMMASNQQETDKLNFNHFTEIRNLCNLDQKKLFNNFIDEISNFFNHPPPPHHE